MPRGLQLTRAAIARREQGRNLMKHEKSDHQGVYAGFAPAILETSLRRPGLGGAPKAAVTMAAVADSAATRRVAAPDHSHSIKA